MTDKQIRDRIAGVLSVSMMPMEMEAECVAFLDRCLEVPKWIPVTERLPEKEGRYLCVVRIGYSGAVYVTLMNGDPDGFSLEHIYNDDVTHWMPLPKLPKDVTDINVGNKKEG